ncbi:MAG TPA: ribonuclease T [Gammaproteobacteria bacterium]|jgi:ribonuclease T|uniref:Ribonuclease T n=1 Tax=OM182 bacterium TaxID=2510334 RepID=A0A520RYA7_9GAMM|nr:MAG: ribonuclease T [OM182 bacterium]HAU23205.1 ribonuclease T [Gammaproteobacteria bacterium]HCA36462.1 ribonuclease T [Gammaproteobacteria bacterium]HCI87431.1 ribonuclease T [Gammaproteobacteria bacterium]|tara:strand:- start:889 stop:1536 length:648 start_codon:yes stop_codon:yes gene_type:complete
MHEADLETGLTPMLADRFRTYLPVVVDIETGGFNSATDAILEIAAVVLAMNADGYLEIEQSQFHRVIPFEGANLEEAALKFTGIDPFHPLRIARSEKEVFQSLFKMIRDAMKAQHCKRAILVGHNAHFDHGFVRAASARHNLKRDPFHPFSSFDTASLSGLAYGQTVLSRACAAAGIEFDESEAHSANYDAERTAQLFCKIVNRWKDLGGWPPSA